MDCGEPDPGDFKFLSILLFVILVCEKSFYDLAIDPFHSYSVVFLILRTMFQFFVLGFQFVVLGLQAHLLSHYVLIPNPQLLQLNGFGTRPDLRPFQLNLELNGWELLNNFLKVQLVIFEPDGV